MVISSSSTLWFDSLTRRCLSARIQPEEFFIEICRMALEQQHRFNIAQQVVELSRQLPKIGSTLSSNLPQIDVFRQSLDYLEFLYKKGVINGQHYSDTLTDANNNSLPIVQIWEIAERLQLYGQQIQCAYNDAEECAQLSIQIYQIFDWHVRTLEMAIELMVKNHDPHAENSSSDVPELVAIIQKFLSTIRTFHDQPFNALMIFLFYNNQFAQKSHRQDAQQVRVCLQKCLDLFKQFCDDFSAVVATPNVPLLACLDALQRLVDLPSFSTPPPIKWNSYRENFIHRRHRPAMLTLCSIFATFRVLKSSDEVADSFLTVGEVLGVNHEQIVEDLLRAGFLIQLETASPSLSEQRDREALADVFVFLKLPQVLSRLLERGVKKSAIWTALGRICECDSLLDELDAKKADNVFRFFLDGVRKSDVIGAAEYEALVSNRNMKRNQNEELLQRLHNIPQSASRSELISRVQKAKRGIDTLVPENTEMLLRRLLSLGEIPLDMLCCIYCAHGELSIFSSKLAALNAQTQSAPADSNPAGRLVIFDSTFLLMARIQSVFADMRLEELVGSRLNCPFYVWSLHYQKCIEEGEPMRPSATAIDQQFRTNFQQCQFPKMRQQKQPYWDGENADFGMAIKTIPLLGELLLDEFHSGQPDSGQIQNVFWTFRRMSCLWLCLVQWLDTQKATADKQAMACAMREFDANWAKQQHIPQQQQGEKDNSNERLTYSMLLARSILHQIAEVRAKKEHPYTWLIGFAQRPLPALPLGRKMSLLRADREEIKEENQRLKEVFLCANQQGWATPDAIAHINRCNESCRMDIWLQCWMRQMMNQQRVVTVDEGELASELCLAATITYPVPCLCEMIKQLVECVLFERHTLSSSSSTSIISSGASNQNSNSQNPHLPAESQNTTDQQHAPSIKHSHLPHLLVSRHPVVGQLSQKATVLAKMLVRAMQLLLWAGDRRAVEKRERERRIQQLGTQMEANTGTGNNRKRKSATTPNEDTQGQQHHLKVPPSICGGLEPTSSEGSGGEEVMNKEAPQSKAANERAQQNTGNRLSPKNEEAEMEVCASNKSNALKVVVSNAEAADNAQPQQHSSASSSTGDAAIPSTSSSSSHGAASARQPKDALKAQLTVRNVFERFERIVRNATLRPPITFILFFLHELAQAPRTEYWHRLVAMMPVEMLFALARLDAPAIPLELFLRIYDPGEEQNRKRCLQFACMMRKFRQN